MSFFPATHRAFKAIFVIAAAMRMASCHPGGASQEPKQLVRQLISQAEGGSPRVQVINLVMSPDRKVVCGMVRIGPVRTTPYWIKLERPYPDLTGAARIRVAPSIDTARDKEAARSAVMRALSDIPERCAQAGAPLPSYL